MDGAPHCSCCSDDLTSLDGDRSPMRRALAYSSASRSGWNLWARTLGARGAEPLVCTQSICGMTCVRASGRKTANNYVTKHTHPYTMDTRLCRHQRPSSFLLPPRDARRPRPLLRDAAQPKGARAGRGDGRLAVRSDALSSADIPIIARRAPRRGGEGGSEGVRSHAPFSRAGSQAPPNGASMPMPMPLRWERATWADARWVNKT